MRPDTMARIRRHQHSVRRATFALLHALVATLVLSGGALATSAPASHKGAGSPRVAFRGFIETLWPLAEARGVSRATFDSAFVGVAFDPKVAASAESQPEFVRPIWDYV